MTSGEDDTDEDLETDSKNKDRDGNVRDISDDYAGVGSDNDAGSCCHWSTRRRFATGTIQPVSQNTPDQGKPANWTDLICLVDQCNFPLMYLFSLFFAHV